MIDFNDGNSNYCLMKANPGSTISYQDFDAPITRRCLTISALTVWDHHKHDFVSHVTLTSDIIRVEVSGLHMGVRFVLPFAVIETNDRYHILSRDGSNAVSRRSMSPLLAALKSSSYSTLSSGAKTVVSHLVRLLD